MKLKTAATAGLGVAATALVLLIPFGSESTGERAALSVIVHDKVSDAVLERTRSNLQEPVDAIVSYRSRPGQMERSRIQELGGEIGRQFNAIDASSVKLPAVVVEELAAEPSVAWISLDAAIRYLQAFLQEVPKQRYHVGHQKGLDAIAIFSRVECLIPRLTVSHFRWAG